MRVRIAERGIFFFFVPPFSVAYLRCDALRLRGFVLKSKEICFAFTGEMGSARGRRRGREEDLGLAS